MGFQPNLTVCYKCFGPTFPEAKSDKLLIPGPQDSSSYAGWCYLLTKVVDDKPAISMQCSAMEGDDSRYGTIQYKVYSVIS